MQNKEIINKKSLACESVACTRLHNNMYYNDHNILIEKYLFYKKAKYFTECINHDEPSKELLKNLKNNGVDLFTFIQRNFLNEKKELPFYKENEYIALLKINSYENWWSGKERRKVRNMVNKAKRKGTIIKSVKIDKYFLNGVRKIYNETPIREGRRYSGYGISLKEIKNKFNNFQKSIILGAYNDKKLIGLLWMVYGNEVARLKSFISYIEHRDKAPNNALMAEAIKTCSNKGLKYLIYEKMGYLPGLDLFKKQNGFKRCLIPRYYIPLSKKGNQALRLKVHRELQYSFSRGIHLALLPLYNNVSKLIPSKFWWRLGGR